MGSQENKEDGYESNGRLLYFITLRYLFHIIMNFTNTHHLLLIWFFSLSLQIINFNHSLKIGMNLFVFFFLKKRLMCPFEISQLYSMDTNYNVNTSLTLLNSLILYLYHLLQLYYFFLCQDMVLNAIGLRV